MAELNKILLIGRLTKDPELRFTPSGTAVAQLRMAVNHTYRAGEAKEKKEEVLFIDVSVFGRSAETVKQYLAKGRELFVEGRLKQDEWTDKNNQKRISYNVVADRFQFLGGGQGRGAQRDPEGPEADGGGPPPDSSVTFDAPEAPARQSAPPAAKEDDLPF